MNNHSLDQLQQFAAFIEFLSHPEEHKKTLEELKQATSDYNKTMSDLRETKVFQVWRNDEIQKLNVREASLEKAREDFNAEVVKTKEVLKQDRDKFEEVKRALTEKEGEVSKRLAELEKVFAMKAELAKEKEALLVRQAAFDEKVAAFEAKQKAIDELMRK